MFERLGDKIVGPGPHGLDRKLDVAIGGHHYHSQ